MRKTVEFNVNLLPTDPFFDTFLGKTLRWALSIGRYIVIFTELVVVASFATRFSLDRQLTDLNTSIYQKQNVIESYGDLEKNFRASQFAIDQYEQIEQQSNLVEIFPELTRVTPLDIVLDSLTITPTSVSLSGMALSDRSLTTFLSNFQLSNTFTNTLVSKIESDEETKTGFKFVLRSDLAGASQPTKSTNKATPND